MINSYVFIVNQETGQRETSFLIGVHGDDYDACLARANEEYPGLLYFQGGDDDLEKFMNGKLYKNGAFVDPEPPTPEEMQAKKLAALDAEYMAILGDYDAQIMRAVTIDQDEDFANELRAEKAEKQAEYELKRGEL